MCLAIPMKIIELNNMQASAELAGLRKVIDIRFVDKLKKGDYVIVHAGFAIQKIDSQKAQETLDLIKSI